MVTVLFGNIINKEYYIDDGGVLDYKEGDSICDIKRPELLERCTCEVKEICRFDGLDNHKTVFINGEKYVRFVTEDNQEFVSKPDNTKRVFRADLCEVHIFTDIILEEYEINKKDDLFVELLKCYRVYIDIARKFVTRIKTKSQEDDTNTGSHRKKYACDCKMCTGHDSFEFTGCLCDTDEIIDVQSSNSVALYTINNQVYDTVKEVFGLY